MKLAEVVGLLDIKDALKLKYTQMAIVFEDNLDVMSKNITFCFDVNYSNGQTVNKQNDRSHNLFCDTWAAFYAHILITTDFSMHFYIFISSSNYN